MPLMQTRGARDSGCDFGQIENQDLQARQRCRATWKYDEHNPSRCDF